MGDPSFPVHWPPDAERVEAIFARLAGVMPEPKTELNFTSPYTLVVAVALSAQATDVAVNKATEKLFAVADTPAKMLALGEEGLIPFIQSIGLYRTSFLAGEDFGIGRHPAAGLQRAQDFSFALKVEAG